MRPVKIIVIAALFLSFPACGDSKGTYQGYVEADYVYVSSPVGGTLLERPVNRGGAVKSGELLFLLEHEREVAAQAEVREQLARSTAQLENLLKGKRPSEIAALEARIAEAQAALTLARKERDRVDKLAKTDVLPKRDFDEAHAQFDRATAALQALGAELTTARLGARDDEIQAARAEVKSREQALLQASWQVEQKRKSAPFDASVVDTFYEIGEWVAPGAPAISLLSPERLKIRFYIPEPNLSTVHVGDSVSVSADGLPEPVDGSISYISPQAEYTPPVIFSRESRSKLVFLGEARLKNSVGSGLNPGQPVEVLLR